MSILHSWFWLAAFLITGCSVAAGTTYYVSPSGNDSNPGTLSAPFQHISHGVAAAAAGDTVVVMDGTYDNEGQVADSSGGGSVVTMSASGTSGNPITIKAQHRGNAILNAASSTESATIPGCSGAWAYFDVSYVAYIVIEGFVIENACLNGIHGNATAHDIAIRWNEIKNIGNWNNPAGTLSPSGIYLNSNEYNITFDGNIFHDIGGGTNVNQQHAIYTSASNVTIVNNIFYNQVHGWDIQTAGSNGIYIINNTFAFENPNRDAHILLWDGGVQNSLSNVIIENNIMYQPRNSAILASLDAGGSISNCIINNNLTDVSTMFDNAGSGATCSQSGNFTNTSPAFVNSSNAPYDFHLQLGSPAIDSGATVSYTAIDFDGSARPQISLYDIGAYEYLSGISGWWKFDGTTADSSGNGNSGTLVGSPGYGAGQTGAAISLNGANQYVSVAESSSLEMRDKLTVAFWINPSSSSLSDPRVVEKAYCWEVKLNNGQPQFATDDGHYALMSNVVSPGAWVHVAFTFSSADGVKAYLNGSAVSLSANTFPSPGNPLPTGTNGFLIGVYSDGTNSFFPGLIDEVRVYNRVLSDSEISALYSAY